MSDGRAPRTQQGKTESTPHKKQHHTNRVSNGGKKPRNVHGCGSGRQRTAPRAAKKLPEGRWRKHDDDDITVHTSGLIQKDSVQAGLRQSHYFLKSCTQKTTRCPFDSSVDELRVSSDEPREWRGVKQREWRGENPYDRRGDEPGDPSSDEPNDRLEKECTSC
ncbi:hypothetical protein BaRGS_00025539 [Batillaria attramentaria]|uniref:Uncharacterized protein n=1 Tax=Batillaria attramentaria TaxID=370345 RepID=A0ABD0K855_9CAEN